MLIITTEDDNHFANHSRKVDEIYAGTTRLVFMHAYNFLHFYTMRASPFDVLSQDSTWGFLFNWHGTATVRKQSSYEISKVEAENSTIYYND